MTVRENRTRSTYSSYSTVRQNRTENLYTDKGGDEHETKHDSLPRGN